MDNTVSGTVHGAVVQVRDVYGDVNVHAAPDAAVPQQLPAGVHKFSGRQAELDLLAQLESTASSDAVVISAVNGTAGVGKTALALHWAHRVAGRFPDGQLYVNMRGFEPDREPMSPAEAVRGFLDALGVPGDAVPIGLDAQAALFRSKVAGQRVLVVLDNVREAAQVRPLLPGGPGCFVLITSRNRLDSLVAQHSATQLRLDLLPDGEAVALLRDRLGDVDQATLADLVELCAGLPLALSIVAARIDARDTDSIAGLVEELRAERLEALELDEDFGPRAVFSWSVRALTEPAARLFRLLGLHPGPDVDVRAAAALAGLPVTGCRKLLRELVRATLVEQYLPGRYRFHDLLRVFARELAGADDAAQRRMLGFYLHSAWAGDRALVVKRVGVELPLLDPVVAPVTFTEPADAGRWFTAEHAVLTGMVGHAAAAGFDQHAWLLALALRSYLDTHGHWRDYESVYRAAIDSVNRLADPFAQARIHRGLGRALSRLSEWDEAERVLRLALDFTRRTGDRRQEAHSHEALSWLYSERQLHDRALVHAQAAVDLHPVGDNPVWRAFALNVAGRCYAALHRFDEALEHSEAALKAHRGLSRRNDETGEAEALTTICLIQLGRGEFEPAMRTGAEALALHRHLGNRPGIAEALEHIGDVHRALDRPEDARAAWEEALVILEGLRRAALVEVKRKLAELDHH
ncbi:NB-ARC domain-containing protein [Nocardia sp. NRRL S-836]|uniref:ATP-binding protein n=1 Tax=Nocardia sp. NRRL S-836 TaxID=1519492 RepID=UPI0006B01E09|nr:NB-ARC domain-containing protein [Nocardia sp. NRRL S-836]